MDTHFLQMVNASRKNLKARSPFLRLHSRWTRTLGRLAMAIPHVRVLPGPAG
jgi:hypothetical protein